MDEWIATRWEHTEDADTEPIGPQITIHRMTSPFYSGVRYAVRRGGACLSTTGQWEFEPLPSSRSDDFYERCRFKSFHKAIRMATAERKAAIQRLLALS